MVFSTLRLWPKENCGYFKQVILQQQSEMRDYPFSEAEKKKVRSFTKIKVSCEKETVIEIPDETSQANGEIRPKRNTATVSNQTLTTYEILTFIKSANETEKALADKFPFLYPSKSLISHFMPSNSGSGIPSIL